MAKNEVAEVKNNAVAIFDESIFDDMDFGNEDLVAAQYKMPLFKIVEPLSKALIPGEAFYIEGAKVGDIIDTAVGAVVGNEIEFVPVKAVTLYIEKGPNDKTVKKHTDRAILQQTTWRNTDGQKKGTFLANGNEIQETIYMYGINISSGYIWGAIPFSRGRLDSVQRWFSALNAAKMKDGVTPAKWPYYVWDLKPKGVKSDSGKPFFTWQWNRSTALPDREDGALLVNAAKELNNALRSNDSRTEIHDDGEADVQTLDADKVPF